jgi:hypothetical protein
MPTFVLRETMPSTANVAAVSARRARKSVDRSLEGVLIFSGLGLGLMLLAAVFNYLQLPPPVF